MIHLITYGDEKYNNTKKRLYNEALNTRWFDSITLYNQHDLNNNFKKRFKRILEESRGGGYWIWKPYVIKKKLDEINDGDVLIYLDAGCSINSNGKQRLDEYVNMLKTSNSGVISFQMHQHLEKVWTTKEIFNSFNIDINDNIANTGQIIGGIVVLIKNANSVKLVNMWNNTLINNPLLFTDYYKNQYPYFNENRHDQSIFSIIRKLHNPILLEDETSFQFGDNLSLKYPFWATKIRE
tara:strand:+ start:118 stop:831 length:714 start_codon:yes stop_codon:yes gene_type:complete